MVTIKCSGRAVFIETRYLTPRTHILFLLHAMIEV